jgi:tetratricopeptide (TPR) repeat protein
MAAKQKRMTKEELRAPDEVEVVLGTFWESLYNYRKALIGGVIALLALGIVLWFVGRSNDSAKATVGDALADALKPVGASTGEEPAWYATLDRVPKPPHYADEATRASAADVALAEYAQKHADHGSVELVELARAQLALRKGDHAAALTAADAWLQKYTSSPAVPLVHDLKARALLAAGRHDDALAAWQAASNLVGGALKAHFLTEIGDLQNPAIYPGRGDAAKAVASYKQAIGLLPPSPPPAIPGMPAQGPRPVLEARIALIE